MKMIRRVPNAMFAVFLFAWLVCCGVVSTQGQTPATPSTDSRVSRLASNPLASNFEAGSYHEDFSALPLDKNHLKLDLEILGEKDDKPGTNFIRERWHLEWRPGDPIDVYVVKPRGIEKPPVILYLYSYPQDTDRFKQDYWCGQTTGGGTAAVGFVSAVTGHRLDSRPLTDDFFNQMSEALGATVHDVQMILNYLETRNDLDMSRVGMFGQGSGGAIAIMASAVDRRIKALDLLTPWGDWPVFLKSSTFIPPTERAAVNKPDFLSQVAPLDPLQWLPKVKARSVRIQDVRKDGHMPDDAQEAIEGAAPDFAELDEFGDAAALFPAAANGRLLVWMRSQLQPDAKPQVAMEKSQRIHFFPPKADPNPLGEAH
jgi:hypothetical protein